MDYPEVIETAADLRAVLAEHVEPHPWITYTRRDPFGPGAETVLVPEPLAPPLPMWVVITDELREDSGERLPVGFVGTTGETDTRYTPPVLAMAEHRPMADQPADLLADRAPALFVNPLDGGTTATLGRCVAPLRAAQVLRRVADRCRAEQDRWASQRVVSRKLTDEATTYDAVADQYEAAAVDSTRFWWAEFRARALAAATPDPGVVVEPIPIRLH